MTPRAGGLPSALELYDEGLRALRAGRRLPCTLRRSDGSRDELPLHRWWAPASPADLALAGRCAGPTLDVGCGPGRLTAALEARGTPALGIDVSAEAVRMTRNRGGQALRRDVFHDVPGAGLWRHVLLADGNVGIGGDAVALLRRSRELLAPDGEVLCEVAPPGALTGSSLVRLEVGHRWSAWFRWATVSHDAAATTAAAAGLALRDSTRWGTRWFACLTRA